VKEASTSRVFVALELPSGVREEIVDRIETARASLPQARWVKAENLHLTLCFLGEQPPSMLAALRDALHPLFAARPALRLEVRGAGCFPPRRPARVLWVGVDDHDSGLADLGREVTMRCSSVVGQESERRPFSAHVTVGRCREPWPGRAVEKLATSFVEPCGPSFVVERGTLFESLLSPRGSEYRALDHFSLLGLEKSVRLDSRAPSRAGGGSGATR
jgi:2'-5' RNA ligase